MACQLIVFSNDTATPEIFTLSLRDALPICDLVDAAAHEEVPRERARRRVLDHLVDLELVVARTRLEEEVVRQDRKSTRLNSSHANISYVVFCLKKKSGQTPSNRNNNTPIKL